MPSASVDFIKTGTASPVYVLKAANFESGTELSSVAGMNDDTHAYADRPIHAKHELKRLRDADYESYMQRRFKD